jgi:GMP synthase (glutamine-hydrolysing)
MTAADGGRRRKEAFVAVIQHEQVEGLGTIAESLADAGIDARYTRARAGEAIPRELGDARGLIVMGGPMGVYEADRYPFLHQEMRLIEHALKAGLPILGICLGSQLLAHVLGAEVKRSGRKEIGWFDVRLTDLAARDPLWKGIDPAFTAFHWHGDVFALPAGSIHLASSDLSPYQAFRHGAAYGLLFHLEVTEGIVRDMVRTWPEELSEERLDGQGIVRDAAQFLPPMREIAKEVFERFAGTLGGPGGPSGPGGQDTGEARI